MQQELVEQEEQAIPIRIEKNFKSNDNLKDWVYVNNFKNTNEPITLSFKPGGGKAFKKDIEDIVDKLKMKFEDIQFKGV